MTLILPAVLGWSNPDTGPTNLRLYAADVPAPRFYGKGRVLEIAVTEHLGQAEGDQFLLVHLGDRRISATERRAITSAIELALSRTDEHFLATSPADDYDWNADTRGGLNI